MSLPSSFAALAAVLTVSALCLTSCTGTGSGSDSVTTVSVTDSVAVDSVATDSVAVGTAATELSVPPTRRTGGPITIKVPSDHSSIQAAVDASAPGDLILIAKGTYKEQVIVRTPNIVIRGEDRNGVILDGADELYNGFQVAANGVAIENLTVQRYVVNGIVFTNQYDAPNPGEGPLLKGYRASYVTVANNGLYGLYAFYAEGGQFDHVYGSGHPDGGIYIGQCKPCNALVTDAVMERNGLGYSGTNASGGLFIVNSIFRRNRIGMSPNSQNMERLAPQGDVVIGGNLVVDNDDPETPPAASGTFGFGIGVGGGERNIIIRNRVSGNDSVGIAITTLEAFRPIGNRVEGNVVENNGTDLAFFSSNGAELKVAENCFAGNTFVSSVPEAIEEALPCGSRAQSSVTASPAGIAVSAPPAFDYRKIALPPPQPNMPDVLTAPAVPATATVPTFDVATLKVPS